jgi:hypothetical protein
MNRIRCPICRKVSGIYLGTTHGLLPDQEYDGIDVFCKCCGKIGETDIKIDVNSVRLQTKSEIENRKEKCREEFKKSRSECFKSMEFYSG